MFLVNSICSSEQNSSDLRKEEKMKDHLLDDDFEVAMKVVIVGNGSVGKSSMIQRYCRGVFTRDYKKTIGVDFLERMITIDNQSIRLMLWDTAGQEEFDAITRTYYRGASACVLACSITDKDSFNALPNWKNKVCRECGDIPMVVVANKTDLQNEAVVTSSQLDAMVRSLGITKLFKTSVKEDLYVSNVFNSLAQEYLSTVLELEDEPEIPSSIFDHNENHNIKDNLVDEPHHKFHKPIFGHFKTNPLMGNNKKSKSKIKLGFSSNNTQYQNVMNGRNNYNKNTSPSPILRNNQNPAILKSQPLAVLPMKGFLSTTGTPKKTISHHLNYINKKDHHYFTSSGNHHTHWDNNMPFRLDFMGKEQKRKRNQICSIL